MLPPITREVLGVEIGARSLVEVLPVVRIKSDYENQTALFIGDTQIK